jgi:hypothetical protein
MAEIDPTIAYPTVTGAIADRRDCYKVAAKLITETGLDAEPSDVLDLAHFLAAGPL